MFDFSKFKLYGIIAAVSISILTTGVVMWKNNIKKQAILEMTNRQLEQIIKDQQTFIIKMNEINTLQKQELDGLNKKNSVLMIEISKIETYLNSEQVMKNDHPSSEILKETIRRLNGDLQ